MVRGPLGCHALALHAAAITCGQQQLSWQLHSLTASLQALHLSSVGGVSTAAQGLTAGSMAEHQQQHDAAAVNSPQMQPPAAAGLRQTYSSWTRTFEPLTQEQQDGRQQARRQQGRGRQHSRPQQQRWEQQPQQPSQQQQPRWEQHQQQQRRRRQQQQQLERPWQHMRDTTLARITHSALTLQHSPKERTLLLSTATNHVLQQLQDVSLVDISLLLHAYEVAATPVPLPAMQQLLQHVEDNAALCDARVLLRVLRSASFSKLSTTSSSSSGGAGQQQQQQRMPSLNTLLQQAWALTSDTNAPLRPSSVPHLLRCLSVLQEPGQQEQLSDAMLDQLLRYWLDSWAADTTQALPDSSSSNSSSSSSSGGGGRHQQQVAQQASMVVKAVQGLGMRLAGTELQQLLLPLLAALQDCTGGIISAGSGSSSSSGGSSSGAWRGLSPAAAVRAAAWLPPMLAATHQLDRWGSVAEWQRGQVLQAATTTLQALAAAATAAAAPGPTAAVPAAAEGRGGALLDAAPASPAAVANSIIEAVKTLAGVQRASALNKVPGLADDLAAALVSSGARLDQISTLMGCLASLNVCLGLDCMTDLTARVCAQLQQQQQQQQQRGALADSNAVMQFLWASACMGYSLGPAELRVLLQQQLATLQPPVSFGVAQSLWAVANMAPHPQQQQQQQQPGQCDSGLSPELQQLAGQLLSHMLQEQQAWGSDRRHSSSSSSNYSGSNSFSRREGVGGVDEQAWPGLERPSASLEGQRSWQVCLAAWAAAMWDLAACKDTVLGLCSILARPDVWATLRQPQYIQLLAVHLWLSGDYQWSATGGLARMLTPQQLQQLRATKLLQVQSVRAQGLKKAGLPVQQAGQAEQQPQLLLQEREDAAEGLTQALLLDGDSAEPHSGSGSDSEHAAAAAVAAASGNGASRQGRGVAGASVAQLGVWKTLKALPEVRYVQLEALSRDQLFNIDVLVSMADGRQLAVEFDGPYHYAVAVPSHISAGGQLGGRGSSIAQGQEGPQQQGQGQRQELAPVKRPKGRAAVMDTMAQAPQQQQQQRVTPELLPVRRVQFRDKALQARGLPVVCVPYYEWALHSGAAARQAYLQGLLGAAAEAAV